MEHQSNEPFTHVLSFTRTEQYAKAFFIIENIFKNASSSISLPEGEKKGKTQRRKKKAIKILKSEKVREECKAKE